VKRARCGRLRADSFFVSQHFPELRIDPAQPIVILAARDEATMKMLAPEEWGGEGTYVPGLFHSDGEKDYVVLRLDAQGTTAYHTVYHEYTHALMHLNFSRILCG